MNYSNACHYSFSSEGYPVCFPEYAKDWDVQNNCASFSYRCE